MLKAKSFQETRKYGSSSIEHITRVSAVHIQHIVYYSITRKRRKCCYRYRLAANTMSLLISLQVAGRGAARVSSNIQEVNQQSQCDTMRITLQVRDSHYASLHVARVKTADVQI